MLDETFIHSPPNDHVIKEMFVFVSVGKDGNEGICAFNSADEGWTPLLTSDERLLPQLENVARLMRQAGKTRIKLIKFVLREDVREVLP